MQSICLETEKEEWERRQHRHGAGSSHTAGTHHQMSHTMGWGRCLFLQGWLGEVPEPVGWWGGVAGVWGRGWVAAVGWVFQWDTAKVVIMGTCRHDMGTKSGRVWVGASRQ